MCCPLSQSVLNRVPVFVRFYSRHPVRTYLAFLRELLSIPKGVRNRFHKQAHKSILLQHTLHKVGGRQL